MSIALKRVWIVRQPSDRREIRFSLKTCFSIPRIQNKSQIDIYSFMKMYHRLCLFMSFTDWSPLSLVFFVSKLTFDPVRQIDCHGKWIETDSFQFNAFIDLSAEDCATLNSIESKRTHNCLWNIQITYEMSGSPAFTLKIMKQPYFIFTRMFTFFIILPRITQQIEPHRY